MNTCKAALKVVAAHRIYLLIYLIGLSVMMMALLFSSASTLGAGSRPGEAEHYDSAKASVAVIDRDGDSGHIASEAKRYLALTSDLVEVQDSSQRLQDAVATNYTDLIVIIPHGYAKDFANSVAQGREPESLQTVTSYTSGYGAMAGMQVDGFLSQLRTAYLAERQSANTGSANADERTGLERAGAQVVSIARRADTRPAVKVVRVSEQSENFSSLIYGYASKFGGYPLMASMIVSIALITAVFNETKARRRIDASPKRSTSIGAAVLSACALVGVMAVIYYLVISAGLLLVLGGHLSEVGAGPWAMTTVTMLCYTGVAVAMGFLAAQFGASEQAANGFANVMGLLVAFTSGAWFDPSIMPDAMIAVGKMLPGWWYGDAIDHALGSGAYLGQHADVAGWASSTGLVVLFAVATVCLGLAIGAVRGRRPHMRQASVAPAPAGTRG